MNQQINYYVLMIPIMNFKYITPYFLKKLQISNLLLLNCNFKNHINLVEVHVDLLEFGIIMFQQNIFSLQIQLMNK